MKWDFVLVLAGIELVVFLVCDPVLCFVFSVRMMLIAQWCFSCCWAVLTLRQGHLSVSCSASEQVHKGAKPGQVTWTVVSLEFYFSLLSSLRVIIDVITVTALLELLYFTLLQVLNYSYLHPWVLLFLLILLPIPLLAVGDGEWASSWCLVVVWG